MSSISSVSTLGRAAAAAPPLAAAGLTAVVLAACFVAANASSKARRGSAPSISRGNSSASTLSSTGSSRVNSIFAAVCGTSTILQSGSSATDTELLVDGHLVGADHGGLEDNPQQQNYDDDNNEYDESGECSPRNTPADVIFDDDYAKRVNLMSNMRKLKKLVNGIIWTNRLRNENLLHKKPSEFCRQ